MSTIDDIIKSTSNINPFSLDNSINELNFGLLFDKKEEEEEKPFLDRKYLQPNRLYSGKKRTIYDLHDNNYDDDDYNYRSKKRK
jgi:hypothetical protein